MPPITRELRRGVSRTGIGAISGTSIPPRRSITTSARFNGGGGASHAERSSLSWSLLLIAVSERTLQVLAHRRTRTRQPRLDSADIELEHVCNLGVFEIVILAQHEHRALGIGQRQHPARDR